MNNDTFKEMIKTHRVKLSFVVLFNNYILHNGEEVWRFYQDTVCPENLYVYVMSLDKDTGSIIRSVTEITLYTWMHMWKEYVHFVKTVDKRHIEFYRKALERAPEQSKGFWRAKISTIIFMLKDKRINRG